MISKQLWVIGAAVAVVVDVALDLIMTKQSIFESTRKRKKYDLRIVYCNVIQGQIVVKFFLIIITIWRLVKAFKRILRSVI